MELMPSNCTFTESRPMGASSCAMLSIRSRAVTEPSPFMSIASKAKAPRRESRKTRAQDRWSPRCHARTRGLDTSSSSDTLPSSFRSSEPKIFMKLRFGFALAPRPVFRSPRHGRSISMGQIVADTESARSGTVHTACSSSTSSDLLLSESTSAKASRSRSSALASSVSTNALCARVRGAAGFGAGFSTRGAAAGTFDGDRRRAHRALRPAASRRLSSYCATSRGLATWSRRSAVGASGLLRDTKGRLRYPCPVPVPGPTRSVGPRGASREAPPFAPVVVSVSFSSTTEESSRCCALKNANCADATRGVPRVRGMSTMAPGLGFPVKSYDKSWPVTTLRSATGCCRRTGVQAPPWALPSRPRSSR